jgi:5-formyltetrahydrofolate cyclo-ligase
VALAYEAQIAEAVPMDDHDHCIDILATATQLHYCSERAKQLLASGAA